MASQIATLGIKIEASDIKRAVKELDRLENQSKDTEKSAKKLSNAYKSMGQALGAIGFTLLAKQLLDQVNTYQALTNKLKLVTTSTEQLVKVQEDLFTVAQDTRGSYEGTIDLYSRLARSTKNLNLQDGELLSITEAVNQAVAISGATAQSASGALFQLGQGLGAGALRGEELNSVLEGTPRLAQAIADGLGVTISQLRVMGAAGELNAEKVTSALSNQASVLASEFAKTEKTISQAFQQIENVALKTFGSLDATDLVESMDEFRAIISDPEIVGGLQTVAGLMLDIVGLGIKAAAGWGMIFQLFTDGRSEISKVRDEMQQIQSQIVTLSRGTGREGRIRELTLEFGALANQLRELTAVEAARNAEQDKAKGGEENSLATALAEQEKVNNALARFAADSIQLRFLEEGQLTRELTLQSEALALSNAELFEQEKTRIAQEGNNARMLGLSLAVLEEQRLEDEKQKALKSITLAGLGNLSTLITSENKKAFKVGQIASIATATIKGFEAATSSYAAGAKIGGPVVGAAFAATSVLATAAQIQKIKSTSFGGGGSTGGAVGGAGVGNIPQQVGPVNPTSAGAAQPAVPQGTALTVNINGGMVNEDFLVNEFIPSLQEIIQEKDVILIRDDSLNGQNLRDI